MFALGAVLVAAAGGSTSAPTAQVLPPPPSYAPSNAFLPHGAPIVLAGGAPDDADLTFVAVGPGGSLLIDAEGVTLGPEGSEAHYSWAEISTVAYAAEGPKHLKVVVHPHRVTAHPCLLAARRRGRLREWLEDLPLILECFA